MAACLQQISHWRHFNNLVKTSKNSRNVKWTCWAWGQLDLPLIPLMTGKGSSSPTEQCCQCAKKPSGSHNYLGFVWPVSLILAVVAWTQTECEATEVEVTDGWSAGAYSLLNTTTRLDLLSLDLSHVVRVMYCLLKWTFVFLCSLW